VTPTENKQGSRIKRSLFFAEHKLTD